MVSGDIWHISLRVDDSILLICFVRYEIFKECKGEEVFYSYSMKLHVFNCTLIILHNIFYSTRYQRWDNLFEIILCNKFKKSMPAFSLMIL